MLPLQIEDMPKKWGWILQRADIAAWFPTIEPTGDLDGNYAHLRMLQVEPQRWQSVQGQLTAYLEQAHADAREFFHADLCLSLDPYNAQQPTFAYPQDLPEEVQLSYFGEAFCGIIAEVIEIVGKKSWTVPVFLFRFHNQAEELLHRLIYGEQVPTSVPGRTGSDFIGLGLDGNMRLQAVLVGEAKCHETFNITHAKNALKDISQQSAMPRSLGQLKRILSDLNETAWRETIRSIEQIQLSKTALPRTDLFVYIFEKPGIQNYAGPRISETVRAECHTCGRPLQIAEVHVPDVRQLVTTTYKRLFRPEGVNGGGN